MHQRGRKHITILEVIKTIVKNMVTLQIFLPKVFFVDFQIIEEILVVDEEVVLVFLWS